MLNAKMITKDLSSSILSSALSRHLAQSGTRICDLERAAGLTKDQLRAFRDAKHAPSFSAFLRLVSACGPGLLNSALAPLGIGGAHLLSRAEVSVLTLNGALTRLAERIAAALEDGVVCHREISQLVPVARHLHCLTGAFLAKYDNGSPAPSERVSVAA